MKKSFLFGVLSLFLASFVSAYSTGSSSRLTESLLEALSGPMFRFVLVFVFFFVLVFYASLKMVNEKAIAIVTASVVSLLIAGSLYTRGILTNSSIIEISIFIGAFLVLFFLIGLIYSYSKILALIVGLVLWGLITLFDIFSFLPYYFYNEITDKIAWLISGWTGLGILAVILFLAAMKDTASRKKFMKFATKQMGTI